MTLLFLLSLLFIKMIKTELTSSKSMDSFTFGYICILLVLAFFTGKPLIKHYLFEYTLSQKASVLAVPNTAKVDCVSLFESMFDSFGFSGLAFFDTGDIRLQYPTCNQLQDYLASPETATKEQIESLHVFTHEAMHIRGERNEPKTDCQAIQRGHFAAELLGVPRYLAKQHILTYYEGDYRRHPYFSKECAPNKSMDEKLIDSIWD